MYILNILCLKGGLAVSKSASSYLPGKGREITCPLKTPCWVITITGWATALVLVTFVGNLLKEEKEVEKFMTRTVNEY